MALFFPSLSAVKRDVRAADLAGGVTETPYTDEIVSQICRKSNIDESQRAALQDRLNFAADIYKFRTANQKALLSNQAIKRHLNKLERQAAKLRRELEGLPAQINRHCQDAYRMKGENGLWEKRFAALQDDLHFWGEISRMARKNILPDKGGRDVDGALFVWVGIMSKFWQNELARPYTFDSHNGEPCTAAGQFLTVCMMPLDPTAISRLARQMRVYLDGQ